MKDRFVFERPRLLNSTPAGVPFYRRAHFFKIRFEIGPKAEAAVRGCMCGGQREKGRLHDAMFVVSELRPRIGKENEEF